MRSFKFKWMLCCCVAVCGFAVLAGCGETDEQRRAKMYAQMNQEMKENQRLHLEAEAKYIQPGEPERVCSAVKAGKYKEIPMIMLEEAGLNDEDQSAVGRLIQDKRGWIIEDRSVLKVDYNNDGQEDILVYSLFNSFEDVDRWCQRYEYLVYNRDEDRFDYLSDPGNLWARYSMGAAATYGCRGGGAKIVKINGQVYRFAYKLSPDYIARDSKGLAHPKEINKADIGKINVSKYGYYEGKTYAFHICDIEGKGTK